MTSPAVEAQPISAARKWAITLSVMVVACNRVVWRPLYRLAERRYRLT